MVQTTVTRGKNGQYKVTIPKSLGEAFDMDGKKLEWKQGSARNKLEVEIIE